MSSCMIINSKHENNVLKNKTICLDPGHGGTADTDAYRVGPSGEREEWINLRVALYLKETLEEKGAKVIMTRTEDIQVPLKERALLAVERGADAFISLHHNATADAGVNFPIVYYHGNASENKGSALLGRFVCRRLREALFSGEGDAVLCSDFTIFPGSGTSVLRNSYDIPGVIGEASFFSNPDEEKRLKNHSYNEREAQAYAMALEDFFSTPHQPIREKFSMITISPFEVFQEAERMNEIARNWRDDYQKGKEIFDRGEPDSFKKAFEFLTRSAKSFPDSPVARECHRLRALILEKWGKSKEALVERTRVNEFYIPLE